ncbi:MAG: cytochrome c3 family protein [Pseudomonadota bacterium]
MKSINFSCFIKGASVNFLSNKKCHKKNRTGQFLITMTACVALTQFAWSATFPTNLTNTGSIINTRHNLSMLGLAGVSAVLHNSSRNQYGEVCVYCHTPHGANNTIAAPLWNRTIKVTNYQTYDELGTTTLTQAVSSTPGAASLTCLSCHDGQTAIDSIINMPGSGMALNSQATTQNTAFLNTWNNTGGALDTTMHRGINSTNNVLGNGTGSDGLGCMTCHSPEGLAAFGPGGLGIAEGNDMRLFNLGTDLRNDHPIGVDFPAANGAGTDWNTPAGVQGSSNYFEVVANGRMDKDEIRTYNGKVECASCHDPHGVPSAGVGTQFNPTFLRKSQSAGGQGSAVCLTCHNK